MSSGHPAAGYEEYCRRLAKTVAFFSPVQQERVFGYVPQPYSSNDQDAYVSPHYGKSDGTNSESNDGGPGGVIFHGSDDPVTIDDGTGASLGQEEAAKDWWGQFFSWLSSIMGNSEVDAAEMGAWVDEYKGSMGDDNNGHGNGPGGFDSSNPGQGRDKSR